MYNLSDMMDLKILSREFIYTDFAPSPACHASTLAPGRGGRLHAAWFGGSQEGAGDVAIYYSYRDGDGWAAPRKAAWAEETPHWNPVLFRPDPRRIVLFYKRGRPIARWQTWWVESWDEGTSWSAPRELVPGDFGGRGPVKNKPLLLADGAWLAGASLEQGTWTAFADRSVDAGRTWQPSAQIFVDPAQRASRSAYLRDGMPSGHEWDKRGVIQPALWESVPGSVHMLLRSSEGQVYRSDSRDNGKTWSQAAPAGLPNNNSGLDLTRLPSGALVLALNPVGQNWGARSPLSLVVSHDNGDTWQPGLVLEDTPGEYSYPAVILGPGPSLNVSYTWNREKICVCRVAY